MALTNTLLNELQYETKKTDYKAYTCSKVYSTYPTSCKKICKFYTLLREPNSRIMITGVISAINYNETGDEMSNILLL